MAKMSILSCQGSYTRQGTSAVRCNSEADIMSAGRQLLTARRLDCLIHQPSSCVSDVVGIQTVVIRTGQPLPHTSRTKPLCPVVGTSPEWLSLRQPLQAAQGGLEERGRDFASSRLRRGAYNAFCRTASS